MTQRNKNIAVIILALVAIIVILIDWIFITREYRTGFQFMVAFFDIGATLWIYFVTPTLPDDNYE